MSCNVTDARSLDNSSCATPAVSASLLLMLLLCYRDADAFTREPQSEAQVHGILNKGMRSSAIKLYACRSKFATIADHASLS